MGTSWAAAMSQFVLTQSATSFAFLKYLFLTLLCQLRLLTSARMITIDRQTDSVTFMNQLFMVKRLPQLASVLITQLLCE